MATPYITPDDLRAALPTVNEARLTEVIADALALASVYAPCFADPTFGDDPNNATKVAVFKAVLRSAIVYDVQSGTGVLQSQSVGPFAQTLDTRTQRSGVLFNKEQRNLLSGLCRPAASALPGVYSMQFEADMPMTGYRPSVWRRLQ